MHRRTASIARAPAALRPVVRVNPVVTATPAPAEQVPRRGTVEQLTDYPATTVRESGAEPLIDLHHAAAGPDRFLALARSSTPPPADPVDFTVHLATPGSTDRICDQYGPDTGGWVNSGVQHQAVINLRRWTEPSEYYQGRPELYHALAVNHEVGHVLGNGHVDCPGPAPRCR
ncbi:MULTISPECIES: DUF3152 domain-containing protein [Kitasatospora]|uniref:DUF3152 domain-containing protein n=1 Tax=Kitasatospora cathayae TaxID=3004092 RepID=A0ABY7PYS0_9ACTN|nr:DUF3152 domain-containing protein [Kitasatospora sp. HUAS 3-15]WBP85526.1 DUF3152 domain-containing protein [Kitasatospora sp. HUAS 3-15]